MKETVLDVLLYLFENYFYADPDAVRDRDSMQAGLLQAGFSPAEISKAFVWPVGHGADSIPARQIHNGYSRVC